MMHVWAARYVAAGCSAVWWLIMRLLLTGWLQVTRDAWVSWGGMDSNCK